MANPQKAGQDAAQRAIAKGHNLDTSRMSPAEKQAALTEFNRLQKEQAKAGK